VRETCLTAYAHQDLPFERLVEEIAPANRFERSPLFRVKLVAETPPTFDLPPVGLTLTPIDTRPGPPKFDILVNIVQTPSGLSGRLEYDAALFSRGRMDALVAHYVALLQVLALQPADAIATTRVDEWLQQAERTRAAGIEQECQTVFTRGLKQASRLATMVS
jgi:non-ribosomal peptide synthetase component F